VAIEAQGIKEKKAAYTSAIKELRAASVLTAGRKVSTDVIPKIKEAAPRRSGRLGESTRAKVLKTVVNLMVGGTARTPYAAPIVYGWSSRPNKAKGWRGGPIRPNPYPYEVVGREADNIRARYEEQIARLAAEVSD